MEKSSMDNVIDRAKKQHCLTIKQAAVYANVPESTVKNWIQNHTLTRMQPYKYGVWIDPDELDILLRFRETFTENQYAREFRYTKTRGLIFNQPLLEFTIKTASLIQWKTYAKKSNQDICVQAYYFTVPFRVISREYAAISASTGGFLIHMKDKTQRVHLRYRSKEDFLRVFQYCKNQ